jgi:hypothetical protein
VGQGHDSFEPSGGAVEHVVVAAHSAAITGIAVRGERIPSARLYGKIESLVSIGGAPRKTSPDYSVLLHSHKSPKSVHSVAIRAGVEDSDYA